MSRHQFDDMTPATVLKQAAQAAAEVILERARLDIPPEHYGEEDYRERLREVATEFLLECPAPGPVLKFLHRAVVEAARTTETE
jgi:hypothetical protein